MTKPQRLGLMAVLGILGFIAYIGYQIFFEPRGMSSRINSALISNHIQE